MKETIGALQVLKNWAKLAVLLGILPWAYYYVTTLGPIVNHALGIDRLSFVKAGFYLVPIVGPPLLLFSLLSSSDPDQA
jgi:hypothetical protein